MLKDILNTLSPCSKLNKTVSVLEKENAQLKQLLLDKQEHINETNKYWKKKMHEVKRKVKHVSIPVNQL